MRRLRRRSGVLLAALGVALSALLVAPVSTAPAQADHISGYDNGIWQFNKSGSWWRIIVHNCFTTNYEYLSFVEIVNNGNQSHFFRWYWTDYYNNDQHFEEATIGPNGGFKIWNSPPSGWGGLPQANHPRVKVKWENSAGEMVLLWDLNGWVAGSSTTPLPMGGAPNGCITN